MSYRDMQKRLEQLEVKREQQERAEYQAWVESLSNEEIERLVAEITDRDPVGYATMDALSDADLERLHAGTMPDAEWEQHRERAQERIGL